MPALIILVRLCRRLRTQRKLGVILVVSLLALSILGNAICFYWFESGVKEGLSWDDALWYSVISVTTIGYGDYSAETVGGRLGTVFFTVILGLGSFSVAVGMSIDWFAEFLDKGQRGMSDIVADRHILVVNFPSSERVVQLVDELQSDPRHQNREIVIISNGIERLPFTREKVLFVRGSPLEQETYQRAVVDKAEMAIVLATSYSDPNSDAVVASSVAVLDHFQPDLHIVAECLDPRHRLLFDSVRSDAVVLSLKISSNLLAQEVYDPGLSQMMEVITSNVQGTTLFSVDLTKPQKPMSYSDLAKQLLDRNINLICVLRGKETFTGFMSLQVEEGDRVIYAAEHRVDGEDLLKLK